MSNEQKLESQSMITTKLTIPNVALERYLREKFPELGVDCRIVQVGNNYKGGTMFKVEHTIQKPMNTPLIQLTMQEKSGAPGGFAHD